jgi:hypothetical protein
MSVKFGDTSGALSKHNKGHNQKLVGGDDEANYLYGDAYTMESFAKGGNDTLIGGNDVPPGSNNSGNFLYGDAYNMTDYARGGNDILTGGNNSNNYLYGDAYSMSGYAKGGNDTLIGGIDSTRINALIGDAVYMSDFAKGGDDILISAANTGDIMWGDGYIMSASVIGGNDTYVFAPDNGLDTIPYFEQGHDRIDLRAFHTTFDQLVFGYMSNGDFILALDGVADRQGNEVLIQGVTSLTANDFIFV